MTKVDHRWLHIPPGGNHPKEAIPYGNSSRVLQVRYWVEYPDGQDEHWGEWENVPLVEDQP